jgi:hypothetical protein
MNRNELEEKDIPKFIEDYLRFCDSSNPDCEWTLDILDYNYVDNEPSKAWELILELIKHATNQKQLYLIAAGPLENIINRHLEEVEKLLDVEVRRNRKFAWTLLGVWPDRNNQRVFTKIRQLQMDHKNEQLDLPEK